MPVEKLQELLDFWFSEFEKAQFIAELTETEIQRALFAMPNNKLPGLDGYTSKLFKVSWAVVLGKNLVAAVKSFFFKDFFLRCEHDDSSSHTKEGQCSRDERLPTNLPLS